ncbi:MAG: glycosyltransferase family 87 protein [Chloroflexota bacterium]
MSTQPQPRQLQGAGIGVRAPWWLGRALHVAGLATVAVILVSIAATSSGADARAYWAADTAHPYGAIYESAGAYLYSPAFLQVIAPLRLLPFGLFFAAWVAINGAVLVWLTGPVIAALLLLPASYSPVWVDLWFGNITILLAAATVIGFRYPGAWSFMLLTKVTPGVGLVWFAVRREWRALLIAGGVTLLVVTMSFAISPTAWIDWIDNLRANAARPEVPGGDGSSLGLRLAAAAVVIAVGARIGAWWAVPIGLFVAQPAAWFIGFNLFLVWIAVARRSWMAPPGRVR